MKVTYVGHATLLVEMAGVRILTDPNFETSLGGFLARVSPPGIAVERLPALDALLLTHAHADHLSFSSLDKLPRDIPLYTPPSVSRWLNRKGYAHATPIDAGERIEIAPGLRLHAALAEHKGNRYGFDRWRSQTNMYLLESDEESVFFAGDTALMSNSHDIVERVLWTHGRQLDLAMLPIGWAPAWKPGFRRGHLTGDDALALFEQLRARAMMPYHWGTFRHVTATAHDAINRLKTRLDGYDGREHVHVIEPGQTLTLGRDARA